MQCPGGNSPFAENVFYIHWIHEYFVNVQARYNGGKGGAVVVYPLKCWIAYQNGGV